MPYPTIVDVGSDGSVLVRSNSSDPYTDYFDLLSSGGGSPLFADPGTPAIRSAGVSLPPDSYALGMAVGGYLTGDGQMPGFTRHDPQVEGYYLRDQDQALQWMGDSVPQVLTNQTNYHLGAFDDPM